LYRLIVGSYNYTYFGKLFEVSADLPAVKKSPLMELERLKSILVELNQKKIQFLIFLNAK